MILGIGIDIIEIDRIKDALGKNSKFMERFFLPDEIETFRSKNYRPATIAGYFAAKEAVVKSLGTGFRNMKWQDVEVYQDELGKPFVKLHNNASKIAYSKGIEEICISISHSRQNAVAQAIAMGKSNNICPKPMKTI